MRLKPGSVGLQSPLRVRFPGNQTLMRWCAGRKLPAECSSEHRWEGGGTREHWWEEGGTREHRWEGQVKLQCSFIGGLS